MNIQEVIESGIIELYVMNALPEDEAARVEALALAHPEIRMEIEDAQTVLEKYAQAHAVAPQPSLKDDILRKIQDELPQNTTTPSNTISMVEKSPLSIKPLWMALTAVASIAAVVFFFQNDNQKKALADCAKENTEVLKNQKIVVYKLDILRRPDTKTIEMKGLKIAPDARVLVYWNAKEKATFLSIQNLPPAPKNMQYQLWAIVNKKPVDAGVFINDVTAMPPMKGFENAESFAVTLEKEGGSLTPTMDEMYVFGAVL